MATGAADHRPAFPYRPDIDGLRALAVLGVVLYHAFPALLPGGYAGVDVFFVISGYLIASLLAPGCARGEPGLARFYARRIRRIFPALVLVLATTAGLGWLILVSDEFHLLGRHLAAATVFGANLLLWSEAGYFDVASEFKPLLHLWSLAIEEQFYLVFPLLLAAGYRWRRPVLLLGITAAASLAACILYRDHHTASFFLPHFRAWELLLGALLACRGVPAMATRHRHALSVAGLALVLAAFALLDKDSRFPGYLALLPTLGTLLVIAAGADAAPNRYALSARGMVAIGLVSYPLYLWHWPLLAFSRYMEGAELSVATRLTCLAASLLLATATYRLVERPLRRGGRYTVATLVLATALVGASGFLASRGHWAPRAQGAGLESFLQVATELGYPAEGVIPLHYRDSQFDSQGTRRETTLFIGDSDLQQFLPRTHRLLATDPAAYQRAIYAVRGGCLPILHVHYAGTDPAGCSTFTADAFHLANQDPAIRTVVIGALWSTYFGPYAEARLVVGEDSAAIPVGGSGSAGEQQALANLEQTLRSLASAGKTVYLVLNMPAGFDALDPRGMIQRAWRTAGITLVEPATAVSRQAVDARLAPVNEPLRALAARAGARVLDPVPLLCNADTCPAVTPDRLPVYWDDRHINATFARNLALLDPTIAP